MAFDYATWKRQYQAHEANARAIEGPKPPGIGWTPAPTPGGGGRAHSSGASSGGGGSKGGVVDLTADDDDEPQVSGSVNGPFSSTALGKRPYSSTQSGGGGGGHADSGHRPEPRTYNSGGFGGSTYSYFHVRPAWSRPAPATPRPTALRASNAALRPSRASALLQCIHHHTARSLAGECVGRTFARATFCVARNLARACTPPAPFAVRHGARNLHVSLALLHRRSPHSPRVRPLSMSSSSSSSSLLVALDQLHRARRGVFYNRVGRALARRGGQLSQDAQMCTVRLASKLPTDRCVARGVAPFCLSLALCATRGARARLMKRARGFTPATKRDPGAYGGRVPARVREDRAPPPTLRRRRRLATTDRHARFSARHRRGSGVRALVGMHSQRDRPANARGRPTLACGAHLVVHVQRVRRGLVQPLPGRTWPETERFRPLSAPHARAKAPYSTGLL